MFAHNGLPPVRPVALDPLWNLSASHFLIIAYGPMGRIIVKIA